MTLYEGLENFRDLYESRLSDSSRRISDPIATDWQRISNEFDLYYEAIALGDYVSADAHIVNIINILNGYGIIVDEPSQGPLPININVYPSTIFVVCDSGGTPVSYTGSYADVIIREGGTDTTSSWTLAIQSVTGVAANISGGNRVNITSLTTTSGEVTVRCTRTGYNDQDVIITVLKNLQGSGDVTLDDIVVRQSVLASENLEQDSSMGYGQNTSVVGIGNLNGTITFDGYYVESIDSGTNTVNIKIAAGDQTSYYVTGNKIILFYDLTTDYLNNNTISTEPFYYVVGDVVSSSFSTYTSVVIGAFHAINPMIEDFINTQGAAGDRIMAVSYISTVVPYKSSIFGHINRNAGFSNNIFGTGNQTDKYFTNLLGYYSSTTTNGEISFSSSSSPVRKSVFLLEGISSSTSQFALKTLSRSVNGEDTYEDEIYLPDFYVFSFTVEILIVGYLGVCERRRYTGAILANASILSLVPTSSIVEITDYAINAGGFTTDITINPNSTSDRIEVLVTPSTTDNLYYTGWVEGVFTDWPTS